MSNVNGVTLKIVEVVGSTGLQLKADPGIPIGLPNRLLSLEDSRY